MQIPIVIGVTGHRDLRKDDIPQLQDMVRSELLQLKNKYSHSPFIMLNSLAAGADMLCAEIALELDISLICPLPSEKKEYVKDFSNEELSQFENIIGKANDVFVAPDTEIYLDGSLQDFHYRQAGIYIALHSNVLLALWDGSPAQAGGCGTAEIVDFMLHGKNNDDNCIHVDSTKAVIHISTPRKKNPINCRISSSVIENKKGSLFKALSQIDRMNLENIK